MELEIVAFWLGGACATALALWASGEIEWDAARLIAAVAIAALWPIAWLFRALSHED